MKEQNEENTQVVERTGLTGKILNFFEKYEKPLCIAGIVILVCIIGIFAISKFYVQPRNVRAAEEMFAAEQWYANNDYELALNGNDDHLGFADIIDDYGCTKSGNLAKYYAGVCQLRLGKYKEAIDLLKSYKGKDTFTKAEALMLLGDANAELNNDKEAVKYYEKAAKSNENFVISPAALFKAGVIYALSLNDKTNALRCFNAIIDNYPESIERNDAEQMVSYAEAL
ncbi:MAG: tetratricopeptide repeat protein [Bacteroidales bacterium]|nr:tetratricopeptide repeat protein [Bacteroidales bacterium]